MKLHQIMIAAAMLSITTAYAASKTVPQSANAMLKEARELANAKKYVEAADMCEKIVGLPNAPKNIKAGARFSRIQYMCKIPKTDEAIKLCQEIIDSKDKDISDVNRSTAMLYLAQIYGRMRNQQKALEVYERMVTMNGTSSDKLTAYIALAGASASKKEYKKAVELLDKGLSLKKLHPGLVAKAKAIRENFLKMDTSAKTTK